MNEARIKKNILIASLPTQWSHNLLPEIQQRVGAIRRKLVVLDDDPTGTQTVYGIPVLTEWSVEQLVRELSNAQAGFYILTNTRGLPESEVVELNFEIGQNLLKAAKIVQCEIAVVSRGDSTLRGHFPSEVEALAEALENRFDGFMLVPFFLEGERFTACDIHYVTEGAEFVPVGQTEFAADNNVRPRYLVAKGGITASDLATKGLNVKRAMVLGQVLPGIPVWKLGEESRYPGMTYVVFPGNVGNERALAQVVESWRKQAM